MHVCLRVCQCACPPLRLLLASGMMWCDIDPCDWLKLSSVVFIWQL